MRKIIAAMRTRLRYRMHPNDRSIEIQLDWVEEQFTHAMIASGTGEMDPAYAVGVVMACMEKARLTLDLNPSCVVWNRTIDLHEGMYQVVRSRLEWMKAHDEPLTLRQLTGGE